MAGASIALGGYWMLWASRSVGKFSCVQWLVVR